MMQEFIFARIPIAFLGHCLRNVFIRLSGPGTSFFFV